MSDLIERLEGLTGPCRECDCLIGVALGWFKVEPNKGWPEMMDYIDISGSQIVYPGNGFDQLVPTFTASIDVAMTLVPDKWGIRLDIACTDGPLLAASSGAQIHNLFINAPNRFTAAAATPAIALCIAALKATP